MPATLKVTTASQARTEIRIGNMASIGRLPESTVCLSSDPKVSRRHAVIRSQNVGDYQIIDLGSRNGTYVDDQQVVLPVRLKDGARIRVGDNDIVFEQVEESSEEYLKGTIAGNMAGSGYVSIFAALMICDIRGFTSATESFSKGDLAHTLGRWFRKACDLIRQNGGDIDKFIGDAFFAYWTKSQTQQPSECQTAFETGQELLRLARTVQWPDENRPFEIVVALHFGKVTCPNIGIIAERDATLMGDAVNTVFRLESVAKEFKQQIVASRDFVDSLPSPDAFTDLGDQMLKGKHRPVRVFGFNGDHEGKG